MNYTSEAIKKAIEGGYRPYWYGQYKVDYRDKGVFVIDGEPSVNFWSYEFACLDPLFWQSLGKVMGWDDLSKVKEPTFIRKTIRDNTTILDDWLNQWMEFVYKISLGKSAEDFFKDLLTKS